MPNIKPILYAAYQHIDLSCRMVLKAFWAINLKTKTCIIILKIILQILPHGMICN